MYWMAMVDSETMGSLRVWVGQLTGWLMSWKGREEDAVEVSSIRFETSRV